MTTLVPGVRYVFKDEAARAEFVTSHSQNMYMAPALVNGFYVKTGFDDDCDVVDVLDIHGNEIEYRDENSTQIACIYVREEQYFISADSQQPCGPEVTPAKSSTQVFDEAVDAVRQFNSDIFTPEVEEFVRLLAFAVKLKS